MKIDVFPHILPKKYLEGVSKKLKEGADFSMVERWAKWNAAISQLDVRLRVMDRYPDVLQVLTLAGPPLETLVTPKDAVELARIANDEMAELVTKYPDRFIAAAAYLPLEDVDAAVAEVDRAITQLHLRGVEVFTNVNGEPLDAPKFRPLFERMAHHDLPIWIHPWHPPKVVGPDDRDFHDMSSGRLWWPYQTSVAMVHLAQSGIFADYPNIKVITHHCGGMTSFFERRTRIESLRNFYADTAVDGSAAAVMCGYAFFGADHLLFGTDAPLGSISEGYGWTQDIIRAVEGMNIPATDKDKIFAGNARRLLRLPL